MFPIANYSIPTFWKNLFLAFDRFKTIPISLLLFLFFLKYLHFWHVYFGIWFGYLYLVSLVFNLGGCVTTMFICLDLLWVCCSRLSAIGRATFKLFESHGIWVAYKSVSTIESGPTCTCFGFLVTQLLIRARITSPTVRVLPQKLFFHRESFKGKERLEKWTSILCR